MSQYDELKRLAEAALRPGLRWMTEFTLATGPDVILALIAENERLERKNANQSESIREYQDLVMGGDVSLGMLKADIRVTTGERDELRAEVAGLRTGYEACERVNAELKAENERLVPFEEAYRTACNVRNRLINEGEELRKALAECVDSLQGEMLQKFGGQLPEDMHPVTRRDYDRDMAELAGYRAAIGKGEQS
ncbi:hypothetical protein JC795_28980 [Pseudomonas veronii]|uniref:hypothetical protein n=1 Tax=Pseudomonas veronii TaxID=76761 RepID=UPI0018E83961|nr:hypothetical protein [Pseudomonas veronii]MBJ2182221.1 hypothetical protein [Pseudomonas veronii]